MTKILDAIRKWAWLAVVVLALCALALLVRNIRLDAAYRAEKAAFKANLAAYEHEIVKLTGEVAAWSEKANAAYLQADAAAATTALLRESMAAKDRENEALKGKIATLPASDIVIQTRSRLGVADIRETTQGIEFSLNAGRINLQRLTDADHFTLVKGPAYEKLIAGKDTEIADLRTAFHDQGMALDACRDTWRAYEAMKTDYAAILAKSERQAKWLRFTVKGVVVTASAVGLYLILKGTSK